MLFAEIGPAAAQTSAALHNSSIPGESMPDAAYAWPPGRGVR
jgi:hypothetical protein